MFHRVMQSLSLTQTTWVISYSNSRQERREMLDGSQRLVALVVIAGSISYQHVTVASSPAASYILYTREGY